MTQENQTPQEKRPSIMVATPMYGGMCTGNYVAGLLGTVNMMKQLQVPIYWAQITNESLITRARNELTRLFLEKGMDYLMFIDADNLQDYSGAFVFNTVGNQTESDEAGIMEVRHGGTGFMLIKRKVFEDLIPHVPTYRVSTFKKDGEYVKPLTHEFFATSIDSTGALLSEDYHFCDLWRKHGGKIYANPFVKLEHVGTYVYGGDIVRSGGNLK